MYARNTVLVLALGLVLLTAGCTTATIPGVPFGRLDFQSLSSSEYKILGDAEGTGHAGHVLFIPFGDTGIRGCIGSMFQPAGSAYSAAMYNAIESVPGADAILLPRSNGKTVEFLLFGESTVTVKGKAIKILKQ